MKGYRPRQEGSARSIKKTLSLLICDLCAFVFNVRGQLSDCDQGDSYTETDM